MCAHVFGFVEEQEPEEGAEQDLVHVLGSLVLGVLVKYWIYICGGMFFIVSFEGTIVMYKIIYMMMLLSCVALYQVPTTRVFVKSTSNITNVFKNVWQKKT